MNEFNKAMELDDYQREALRKFDNEEKRLLICPHCGYLLTEIEIRREQYVYESYQLSYLGTNKITYCEDTDEIYMDDENPIYYCGNCNEELDENQMQELIDRNILEML